jgi:hypothetical protein
MSNIVRNKEQITATVTPYLKSRCIEIARGPDFTSISDIVTQALSEFINKYDERKHIVYKEYEINDKAKYMFEFILTKDGQDLIEKILKHNPKIFSETKESDNPMDSIVQD